MVATNKQRLTKRFVDGLSPGPKRFIAWDTEVPGFGIRVAPSGRKVYVLQYRLRGQGRYAAPKTTTLGSHGALTLEQARLMARDTWAAVNAGSNPNKELSAHKDRPTVSNLIELNLQWLRSHRKPRSVQDAESILRRYVEPHLGKTAVADVRRRDVMAIVQKLESNGHARTGGKVVQICRAMFNRAELDEMPWFAMRDPGTNPCLRISVHLGEHELGTFPLTSFSGLVRRSEKPEGTARAPTSSGQSCSFC